MEQRFKIKFRGDQSIALDDIDPSAWKARTVTRGDRFKYGQHFDATAAPVIHTPALKVLIAWAVAKGLLLYQWDQGAAFYGNPMDREGIIVRLPPGYDPESGDIRPLHLPPLYGELAKALPGIPQGSLLHYLAISPALQELQFRPVDADNCLFIHATLDMATSLHVDDGVLAAPSHEHAVRVLGSAGLGAKRTITVHSRKTPRLHEPTRLRCYYPLARWYVRLQPRSNSRNARTGLHKAQLSHYRRGEERVQGREFAAG